MKAQFQINEALEECLGWRNSHGPDQELGSDDWNNNEGWIEALEFVLKDTVLPEETQKALNSYCRTHLYNSGLKMMNGCFCDGQVVDTDDKYLFIKVTAGISNDVENHSESHIIRLNMKTLKIS